jgi:glycosyltransferase involved in cell wall biosynthesis
MKIKRAMAFSPQMNIEKRFSTRPYKDRGGWLSLQTFKGWKHVPDLVAAVPHMGEYKKRLAGKGIDYYYLTSKTKCKWPGIWDNAILSGMRYYGYLTNEEREKYLSLSRCLIDPSWSKKYAKIGDHFNRVVIDGIIGGCVPIARNLGVATNEEGVGELFIPGKNYIMIPWNATPKEFAGIVDHAVNMSNGARVAMLNNASDLLPHFDYRVTAQTFIDLSFGKAAGFYGKKSTIGEDDPELSARSSHYIHTFFGE